jgi:hypothetical protein
VQLIEDAPRVDGEAVAHRAREPADFVEGVAETRVRALARDEVARVLLELAQPRIFAELLWQQPESNEHLQ